MSHGSKIYRRGLDGSVGNGSFFVCVCVSCLVFSVLWFVFCFLVLGSWFLFLALGFFRFSFCSFFFAAPACGLPVNKWTYYQWTQKVPPNLKCCMVISHSPRGVGGGGVAVESAGPRPMGQAFTPLDLPKTDVDRVDVYGAARNKTK